MKDDCWGFKLRRIGSGLRSIGYCESGVDEAFVMSSRVDIFERK